MNTVHTPHQGYAQHYTLFFMKMQGLSLLKIHKSLAGRSGLSVGFCKDLWETAAGKRVNPGERDCVLLFRRKILEAGRRRTKKIFANMDFGAERIRKMRRKILRTISVCQRRGKAAPKKEEFAPHILEIIAKGIGRIDKKNRLRFGYYVRKNVEK